MGKRRRAQPGAAQPVAGTSSAIRERGQFPGGLSAHHERAQKRTWFWSKRPVLRFVLLFCILMILFEGICIIPVIRETLFPAYMRLNAKAGAGILRVFGHEARASGIKIVSPRFAIELRRGCDAIEPSAVLIAAILAFPSAWRAKLSGGLVGTLALMVLNFVRIVSLFLVGVYFPKLFDVAHVEVWQAAFILLALLFWSVWALRVSRPRLAHHAPV